MGPLDPAIDERLSTIFDVVKPFLVKPSFLHWLLIFFLELVIGSICFVQAVSSFFLPLVELLLVSISFENVFFVTKRT